MYAVQQSIMGFTVQGYRNYYLFQKNTLPIIADIEWYFANCLAFVVCSPPMQSPCTLIRLKHMNLCVAVCVCVCVCVMCCFFIWKPDCVRISLCVCVCVCEGVL